ncbi:MAG: TIGR04282 family arsenosugar biosynthesis glycosyltransferase [Bacteroidota bacterium]|nr:TIGR04282 family arsenosugar biosynthesis glycosyltransferase [Bacteroidota bacterium]
MHKNSLIIFAKNPVLGKVKTRLAKDTGEEKALEVYKVLLKKTYQETKDFKEKKFLFLSDFFDKNLFDSSFIQVIQTGNDLGEKMKNAFEIIFQKRYTKAVIIGTDCPELDSNIINEAFEKLSHFDIVIGPAKDGGYYLLGMKEQYAFLFENMKWSDQYVSDETIRRIIQNDLTYHLLKELIDIDDIKDLKHFKSLGKQI